MRKQHPLPVRLVRRDLRLDVRFFLQLMTFKLLVVFHPGKGNI